MGNTRLLYVSAAVIAALLILANVLLFVVIAQNNAAAEQAEHSRIVAICEQSTDYDDLDALVQCVEELKSND